jgi:hypothetical protein
MEPLAFGENRWPTVEIPLASLGLRVDELATRLNLPIHTWYEDGLGPARGVGCRLPSGRLFLLEELQLAVEHRGSRGPTLFVDAADLTARGVGSLLEEILQALHLSRSDVTWILDRAGEEEAARWLRDFQGRSQGT